MNEPRKPAEQVEQSNLEFRVALSDCEDRIEFVSAYLDALKEKLEQMKPLYKDAIIPNLVSQWQCAAFLVACGKTNLPMRDGAQTLREFVQFVDDALSFFS